MISFPVALWWQISPTPALPVLCLRLRNLRQISPRSAPHQLPRSTAVTTNLSRRTGQDRQGWKDPLTSDGVDYSSWTWTWGAQRLSKTDRCHNRPFKCFSLWRITTLYATLLYSGEYSRDSVMCLYRPQIHPVIPLSSSSTEKIARRGSETVHAYPHGSMWGCKMQVRSPYKGFGTHVAPRLKDLLLIHRLIRQPHRSGRTHRAYQKSHWTSIERKIVICLCLLHGFLIREFITFLAVSDVNQNGWPERRGSALVYRTCLATREDAILT